MTIINSEDFRVHLGEFLCLAVGQRHMYEYYHLTSSCSSGYLGVLCIYIYIYNTFEFVHIITYHQVVAL